MHSRRGSPGSPTSWGWKEACAQPAPAKLVTREIGRSLCWIAHIQNGHGPDISPADAACLETCSAVAHPGWVLGVAGRVQTFAPLHQGLLHCTCTHPRPRTNSPTAIGKDLQSRCRFLHRTYPLTATSSRSNCL